MSASAHNAHNAHSETTIDKVDTFELTLDYVRILAGIFISNALVISLTYRLPDDKYGQLVSFWIFGLLFSGIYFFLVVVWRTHVAITVHKSHRKLQSRNNNTDHIISVNN
jgi:formate/nitrite transporter FocA (FNT family)